MTKTDDKDFLEAVCELKFENRGESKMLASIGGHKRSYFFHANLKSQITKKILENLQG